jgi:hypothetical protein
LVTLFDSCVWGEATAMWKLIRKLWQDDRGTVMGAEWVFVATILVLGAVTGLVAMRQTNLSDLASSVRPASTASAPAAQK